MEKVKKDFNKANKKKVIENSASKNNVKIKKNKSNQNKVKSNRGLRVKKKSRGFFGKLKDSFLGESKKEIMINSKNKPEEDKLKDNSNNKIIRGNISSKEKGIIKNKGIDRKIDKKSRYVKTGISGFDNLFNDSQGIPSGASVLVEGGPGSGKTIFCLETLNNLCKEGKKGLYMSFEEPENKLISHMEGFGWNPQGLIKKGLLRITRFDAIDISRSIEALLGAAKKELLIDIDPILFPEDFEADFVVLDSLTSIASAFSGEDSRFRVYMEQLFRYLEKHKITNFLIREVSSPSHIGTTFKEQGDAVSFLSDGIIVLYNVIYDSGNRSTAIEILKMRGVNFKKRIVDLKIINKKGVEVYSEKILKRSKKSMFKLT